MATKTLTPEEQIADARWWLEEVKHLMPPGCIDWALTGKTAAWLADLEAKHARGELEPIEVEYDPDVEF